MQSDSGQRCWFAMPFWQRMGAIFEHFWSIFGSRAHFYNYVLYVGPRGTKLLKSIGPFWGHFLTVLVFWGSPFFDVFLVPLLDGILVSFGAKVAPKRELLGIILETIWRP